MSNETAVIIVGLFSIALLVLLASIFLFLVVVSKDISEAKLFMALTTNNLNVVGERLTSAIKLSQTIMDTVGTIFNGPNGDGMPVNLKDMTFFTTPDGSIQADNVEEFIDKLEQTDEYKEIADQLKSRLEQELLDEMEENDEDDEDESGFGK